MSRILIAWQLGGNYGHLTTDLPVAVCLRDQGHEVVFAVPSAHAAIATELLSASGFTFSLVPQDRTVEGGKPLASYAEIMLATGFGEQARLESLIEGWSRLIGTAQSDLLVADHAPLAVLAARSSGIPSVLIGNGFTVPPLVDQLPSIRPWEPVPETRLRASEAAVLARINTYAARSGMPALDKLSQLFAACGAIVTTTPELDPYGPRSHVHYVGPVAEDALGERIDWPAAARRRVFSYLRASAGDVCAILTALEECAAHVICAMPGASEELERHFEGTRLTLVGRTVPLTPLLPQADAVVGFGGSGLISATLQQGVPMLLVPQNPEQYLGSVQVAKLGAGIVIGMRSEPDAIARGLEMLLGKSRYRDAAKRYAHAYREHNRGAAARRAAAVIEAHARGARP